MNDSDGVTCPPYLPLDRFPLQLSSNKFNINLLKKEKNPLVNFLKPHKFVCLRG